MKFQQVEDMRLWHSAKKLWRLVHEVLDRPGFSRNRELRDQLRDASDSIVANIEEGFQQQTDRMFARYLYTSKGSTAEVRGRLERAAEQELITNEELRVRDELGKEVARMTVGLIKYLARSNRKNRGLGKAEDT